MPSSPPSLMQTDHQEDTVVVRPRDQTQTELVRSCPICQRKFTKTEHVFRHMRAHTKERPFICQFCNKSFPRNDTLKRHERSHSESGVPHSISRTRTPRRTATPRHAADRVDSQSNGSTTITLGIPAADLRSTTVEKNRFEIEPVVGTSQPSDSNECSTSTQFDSVDDNALPGFNNIPDSNHGMLNDSTGTIQYLYSDYPLNFDFSQEVTADSWLLANDFDIGTLDLALNAPISEWAQSSNMNASGLPAARYAPVTRQDTNVIRGITELRTSTDQTNDLVVSPSVSTEWFTRLRTENEPEVSGHFTSRALSLEPGQHLDVDEQFRDTVSRELRPRQWDETNLSVDYLNMCIRLYFTRFHPIFPIIHAPTFRLSSSTSLSFLSMCSLGSLFIGSSEAVMQGHKIYSRLNKAVLASWDSHLSGGMHSTLSVVQTALLGQTFGLLSRRSNDLVMSDAYHGISLAWARRIGAFTARRLELPPEDLDSPAQKRAWLEWLHGAQLRRLALAIYIHDAELACLFHHEPLSKHASVLYFSPLSDALFQAPTAEKWYSLVGLQRRDIERTQPLNLSNWIENNLQTTQNSISLSIQRSQFAAYAILENINGSIIEARRTYDLGAAQRTAFTELLILWYRNFVKADHAQKHDYLQLKVLWHATFMTLCTDFEMLERAIGREGSTEASVCVRDLMKWAASTDGVRSILHANMLWEHVENMKFNATPPLHVPRALFNAGVASLCYERVRRRNRNEVQDKNWSDLIADLPESQVVSLATSQHVVEFLNTARGVTWQSQLGMVYGIIELLQKTSRWGISESFVVVLKETLSGTIDD